MTRRGDGGAGDLPALMIIASMPSDLAAWMRSRRAPSWLLWKATSEPPASLAAAAAVLSMSARVVDPYFSGSRLPSKLRLGPWIRRTLMPDIVDVDGGC